MLVQGGSVASKLDSGVIFGGDKFLKFHKKKKTDNG